MKSLIQLTLIAGCSLAFAGSALASGPKYQNFYADLLVGYGKVNIVNLGDNTGFAGNIDLGYRFNRNFGVEVGYNHFKKMANTESYSTDIALKGIIPIDNTCFDLYGKVGVAAVHARGVYTSNTSPAVFTAAGVSYRIDSNLALTGQVTLTTRNENEVPAMYGVTGGITYLF